MQRRSQGNNELAEFHPDITALERSNRRGANRGSAQSVGGNQMRHIRGSGERKDNYNSHFDVFDRSRGTPAKMGITVPESFYNIDFKPGLIRTIETQRFYGSPGDDPLDHLDRFSQVCSIYDTGHLPPNVARMILFPRSLAGDAIKWEQNTPSERLSNWDDIKVEFLNAYFPKEKAAKFRNYIITFKQNDYETFAQAWERMKRYVRMYPHHGFSKKALLGTFYRGCSITYQIRLDTACRGNFIEVGEEEGEFLVSRLARNGKENDDEDLKLGETGTEPMQRTFAELSRKLELILARKSLVREVNVVSQKGDMSQRGPDDGTSELLRSLIHESFNTPGKRIGEIQPVNSKYQQFHEGEFKKAPYFGTKGLYISKTIQPAERSWGDKENSTPGEDYLDGLVEDMIKRKNENAMKTEKVISTLRTGTGKRTRIEQSKELRNITKQEDQGHKHGRHSPLSPTKSPVQNKKLRVTRKEEFCQFIEDVDDLSLTKDNSPPAKPEELGEPRGANMEEKPPDIQPRQDYQGEQLTMEQLLDMRIKERYDDVVRTLDLVEGTPEHETLEKENNRYREQYHALRGNKESYERDKAVKDAQSTVNIETAKHDENHDHSIGFGKMHEENEVETPTYQERIHEVLWEASHYFAPATINGNFIRACIFDDTSQTNTMTLTWARTLGICRKLVGESSSPNSPKKVLAKIKGIPVKVGKINSKLEFDIVNQDQQHKGYITLGRSFLEDNDAVLYMKKGVIILRPPMGWDDELEHPDYHIWRQPLIMREKKWLNIGLIQFYFETLISTKRLPQYRDEDLRNGEKGKPPESHTANNPRLGESQARSKTTMHDLAEDIDGDLRWHRHCDDLDIPYWAGNLSQLSICCPELDRVKVLWKQTSRLAINSLKDLVIKGILQEHSISHLRRILTKEEVDEMLASRTEFRSCYNRSQTPIGNNVVTEVPQPTEQPPKVVTTAAIPAGDEIEPGDTGNQTREDPQLS